MKYSIVGKRIPTVICELKKGETVIAKKGSMCWMSSNVKTQTVAKGGIGKSFLKIFAGEPIFENRYTAVDKSAEITFSPHAPCSIKALNIEPKRDVIVAKSAFIAAESGVELSVKLNKKLKSGIFGKDGFTMHKLSGKGVALIAIDSYALEYDLDEGQSIIVGSGYLAAMDATCTVEVESAQNAKSAVFGGDGMFNTVVKGPGKVILQTTPTDID